MKEDTEIASEIFRSLVSVLSLIGMEKAGIAKFFRQAADSVEGASLDDFQKKIEQHINELYNTEPENDDLDLDNPENHLGIIEDRYRSTDEFKALERVYKRYSSLNDRTEGANVQKAFPLLLELIRLRVKAKDFLKAECARNGVQFELYKDRWQENASDEDLDNEDKVIFFDELYFIPSISDWEIKEFSNSLSESGDMEQLQVFYNDLTEAKDVLPDGSPDIVTEAINDIDIRAKVNHWYIEQLSGLAEGIQKSKLIDSAIEEFKDRQLGYKANHWLELLGAQGKVKLMKKSTRWWVQAA